MPAVPGGRPACLLGQSSAGPRRRSPPGTPRPLLSAFPSGRAGPPARPRPAARFPARTARAVLPLLSAARASSPGGRLPASAGRGPDLTGRAERSVRRRDPTDRPPPGTQTASGRPPATPADEPGTRDDPLLTIDEVSAELRVSRAAFYRWRRQGAGPPVVRLPGGTVRVRRSALTEWLRRLEDAQDGQEQGADGQLGTPPKHAADQAAPP
jgi:excisionase family DNA binding protein